MSCIKLCLKVSNPQYVAILDSVIASTLKKIDEDDFGITWIICYEEDVPADRITSETSRTCRVLLGNYRYGSCDVHKRKIWISTQAILETKFLPENELMVSRNNSGFGYSEDKKEDRLVDVILDELTHIKTGCDHGDDKYESCLNEYKERYFGKQL